MDRIWPILATSSTPRKTSPTTSTQKMKASNKSKANTKTPPTTRPSTTNTPNSPATSKTASNKPSSPTSTQSSHPANPLQSTSPKPSNPLKSPAAGCTGHRLIRNALPVGRKSPHLPGPSFRKIASCISLHPRRVTWTRCLMMILILWLAVNRWSLILMCMIRSMSSLSIKRSCRNEFSNCRLSKRWKYLNPKSQ